MTETVDRQAERATTLSAPDITCGGCANAIRRAVAALDGVVDVSVDVAAKTVRVRHGAAVGETNLLDTLDRAGFPASVIQEGRDCGTGDAIRSYTCCQA
ncbi:MAG: heavy-metal-associated domain-containing protein [Akkermansiaceae bacterium]|nr:heavy-metal-associated domain-containing protein [Armatimonadota bacterium]